LKTLLQFIYEHEKNLADRIWLTQPMGNGVLRTFTWKEAIDEARRMATWLRDRAYPPGTRIAILSKNCAWWLLSDLAIWMAGHVSVPIYPTLTAGSVRAILEHSDTKLVFVGKLDGFAEMEPGIPSGIDRVSYPVSPDGAGASWTDICLACTAHRGRAGP
jgi:long-chain acyl-CoA synthetase